MLKAFTGVEGVMVLQCSGCYASFLVLRVLRIFQGVEGFEVVGAYVFNPRVLKVLAGVEDVTALRRLRVV